MKTTSLTLIVLTLAVMSFGQSFSEKTNAIKLSYKGEVVATTLPSISWVSPKIERSNSVEGSIEIEAEVTSNIDLKEIKLELTSGGETRTKSVPVSKNEFRKTIKQRVNLQDGENSIRIVVINEKGGMVSSVRSVLTGKDAIADAVDINRKDYALIFATDNYDQWDDLVNPVNDAKTIEGILKEKYGFQTDLVTNPTNDEILTKIYDYNTRRFNPQDQLFVFFAGHGAFDETLGEGYVVASNSLHNDKGRTTYISHILLRERLNNIKCEHIFLMMDVCFGGTIDPVLAKARAGEDMDEATDRQYLVKKLTKPTRKYLTSGSKEYVPDGHPGKHSPFAEKFILSLKEVGGGTGRILTLLELQTYFKKLATEPRFGSFGRDDPASDFVFVSK